MPLLPEKFRREGGPGRPKGSKNKLSKERIEEEIRRIAFLDPARLFFGVDERGRIRVRQRYTLREIVDMPEEVRACIASIKVRTENLSSGDGEQDMTVEIKLWDKVRSLELAARAFGMLRDKVDVNVTTDLATKIAEGRQRASARHPKP